MQTVDFVEDFLKGLLGHFKSQFGAFRNTISFFSDMTKKEEI